MTEPHSKPENGIIFWYKNHRGEEAYRHVRPIRLWWGSTEYHPEQQWLLKAVDLEKNAERDFALKDARYMLSTCEALFIPAQEKPTRWRSDGACLLDIEDGDKLRFVLRPPVGTRDVPTADELNEYARQIAAALNAYSPLPPHDAPAQQQPSAELRGELVDLMSLVDDDRISPHLIGTHVRNMAAIYRAALASVPPQESVTQLREVLAWIYNNTEPEAIKHRDYDHLASDIAALAKSALDSSFNENMHAAEVYDAQNHSQEAPAPQGE